MEEKTRTIIISVALFLAAVGVLYFLDLPQYKQNMDKDRQIAQINNNIASKKSYNELINQQTADLEAAGWNTKKASIEINFADNLFFIPKMRYFFQTTTATNGLSLDEFTFSAPESVKAAPIAATKTTEGGAANNAGTSGAAGTSTPENINQQGSSTSAVPEYFSQIKQPLRKTTFNLTISGSYNGFKNFLQELETQTRIITIRSIVLSSESQSATTAGSETGGASAGGQATFSPNKLPFKLVVDAYSY